jgi:putative membrane protein
MNSSIRYLNYGVVAAMTLWGSLSVTAADTSTTTAPADTTATATGTKLDHRDNAFIKEASQGGLAEIEMGRMAEQHAQNAQVKQLAERLVQDHTKANQQLMQIAQQDGVNLPPAASRKESHTENKLQGKTGAAFDKAFVEHALTDHEKDIKKFQTELQNTKSPQLKAWIEQTLPALRQHLELARAAGASVGLDQGTLNATDRFLSQQGTVNQGLGTSSTGESGRGASGSALDRNSANTHGTTSQGSSTSGQTPK